MQLFYSGSVLANQPQPQSSLSLGGCISSTAIPNGLLNNLFDSMFIDVKNTHIEYKAVFMKNMLPNVLNNIQVRCNTKPSNVKIEIAIVTPNSSLAIERISNSEQQPIYINSFIELTNSPINIVNTLNINEIIGIWFKKTTTSGFVSKQKLFDDFKALQSVYVKLEKGEALTAEENALYLKNIESQDNIQIAFSYD